MLATKVKRLLFLLLMMTCSVSWAEWIFISKDSLNSFYYEDKSIRKRGDVVRMWTMRSGEELDAGDGAYKSVKRLCAYDCKKEIAAILSIAAYSETMGNGSVVRVHDFREIDWAPIIPDTHEERQWKIACDKK